MTATQHLMKDNVITNTLGKTVNRRSLVKAVAGISAAAALAPTLGLLSPAAARSTDSLIVNTAGARLRSGPGTGYQVLASLAKGIEVRFLADGGTANGYRWYKVRVLATGKEGFVAANLLSAPDGSTSPVIVGTAKTTANVNLRSGPSTSNSVLRVVPAGSTVQISNTVQNGFRYVIHNGLAGWIIAQYLGSNVPGEGPYDPNFATTTARLNLRAEPNPSAKVLLVMPSGAQVRVLEGGSGQFRKVSYNGTTGWAATAYLN
jgi:D-alanyl-D-alanine carboxypeptidase